MKALVLQGPGRFAVEEDWPRPSVKPGWARVRVHYAGICVNCHRRRNRCGADVELRHGRRCAPGDSANGQSHGTRRGYILQSSHTILEDVPMDDIVAYIEEVRSMAHAGEGAGDWFWM